MRMVSSTSAYCGGCHGHWNICYDSTYIHKAHKKKQTAGYTQAWTETPWEEDSSQWRNVQQTRSPRRRTNSPRQRGGSARGKTGKGHPEEQVPAQFEKGTAKGKPSEKGGAAACGFMPPSAQWMQPPVHPFSVESASQTSTTAPALASTAMQPFRKSRMEKDKEDADLIALRNLSDPQGRGQELSSVSLCHEDSQKETFRCGRAMGGLPHPMDPISRQGHKNVDCSHKLLRRRREKFAEKHQEAAEYLQQVRGQLHAIHVRTMEGTVSAGELQEGQTGQTALDASMQIEEMDDVTNQPHLLQLKTDLKGVVQKVRDTIDEKITKRSISARQADGDEARNVDEFVTCAWRGDGHGQRRFRRLSFWPTVRNQHPDGKRTRSICKLLSPPDLLDASNPCGFCDWNRPLSHSVVWEHNYISPDHAQTRALLLECSLTFPILTQHFDEIFFEPFIKDPRHPVPVCDLQELGLWYPPDVQPTIPDEVHGLREAASAQNEATTFAPNLFSSNSDQSDSSCFLQDQVVHPRFEKEVFEIDQSELLDFFHCHRSDCQAPLSDTAVLSRQSPFPISYRPDPHEIPNLPDPPVFSDEENSPRRGQRDGRRPLHHFPGWTAEIWEILQQEGAVEVLEESPIIYLGSYHISHESCIRQPQNRPLRFDQHYERWDEIIKEIWQDHFDHLVGYMFHLVRPEPPLSVTQGTVGVFLIITQHPVVGKAAVLTASVFDRIQGPEILEIAHSLDLRVSYTDVLQCAKALEACQQLLHHGFRPCTIRSGRHLFPRDQDLRVHGGLGLVIRIPSSQMRNGRDECLRDYVNNMNHQSSIILL
eukprot:s1820_g17.t1